MTTAEKIKAARVKAGLTRAQLAERMGIAPHAVAKWEGGERRPAPRLVEMLARALGLKASELGA